LGESYTIGLHRVREGVLRVSLYKRYYLYMEEVSMWKGIIFGTGVVSLPIVLICLYVLDM